MFVLIVGSGYTSSLYQKLFSRFKIPFSVSSLSNSGEFITYNSIPLHFTHAFICTPINSHLDVCSWLLSFIPDIIIYCEKPFCFPPYSPLPFSSENIYILTNRDIILVLII